MNPEFHRNLLLDMSLHRLIGTPLVLLLIYTAVGLADDADSMAKAAQVVMLLALVLWGTRLAADSVLGEVAARTWDSQRMSSLGPWSMSWAKLLGSTVAGWYLVVLSIPVFLYSGRLGFDDLVRTLLVGIFAQCLALFASLVIHRLRPEKKRLQVTLAHVIGIGGFAIWYPMTGWHGEIDWYGVEFVAADFTLLSAFVFLAWAGFGIYRLMRAELQFRTWPVGWTGFALFCAAYAAGFSPEKVVDIVVADIPGVEAVLRLLVAYVVLIGLTWIGAYGEPKGYVRLRRWGDRLKSGEPARILESTPVWAPGLLAGLLLGVVLIASWSLSPDAREVLGGFLGMESLGAFTIALFLFLLRDAGVVYFLTLDGRSKRGLLASLVYLAALYVLLPLILFALDLDAALPVLIPYPTGDPLVIVLPVLMQTAAVASLLVLRWRRIARTHGGGLTGQGTDHD